MFDPSFYYFLQFECIDDTAESITEEAACREPRSSLLVVFLKPRPFVKWNNAEFTNVSCFNFILCAAHTLHCLAWYYLPNPPATILSSLCLLKSLESLLGEFCLGPLGVVCFSGNCQSSELNLFGFWTSYVWGLLTSCRKLLYIFSCLCLVFYITKMHWRMYSLADTFSHLTVFLRSE